MVNDSLKPAIVIPEQRHMTVARTRTGERCTTVQLRRVRGADAEKFFTSNQRVLATRQPLRHIITF